MDHFHWRNYATLTDKIGVTVMDNDNLQDIIANPFYAINFDDAIAVEHETIVSEEDWIKANAKLIKEIGTEKWLQRLLDKLRAK